MRHQADKSGHSSTSYSCPDERGDGIHGIRNRDGSIDLCLKEKKIASFKSNDPISILYSRGETPSFHRIGTPSTVDEYAREMRASLTGGIEIYGNSSPAMSAVTKKMLADLTTTSMPAGQWSIDEIGKICSCSGYVGKWHTLNNGDHQLPECVGWASPVMVGSDQVWFAKPRGIIMDVMCANSPVGYISLGGNLPYDAVLFKEKNGYEDVDFAIKESFLIWQNGRKSAAWAKGVK